jgi:hypothetical protein
MVEGAKMELQGKMERRALEVKSVQRVKLELKVPLEQGV